MAANPWTKLGSFADWQNLEGCGHLHRRVPPKLVRRPDCSLQREHAITAVGTPTAGANGNTTIVLPGGGMLRIPPVGKSATRRCDAHRGQHAIIDDFIKPSDIRESATATPHSLW